MNVSQTILARVLASVGNLLTVLGISANPARTPRTETQTHSVTWAGTCISEAGVPLVCALSSRSAVHALVRVCARACVCTRVCVCPRRRQGRSDWGEGARSAPALLRLRLWTSDDVCVSDHVFCTLTGSWCCSRERQHAGPAGSRAALLGSGCRHRQAWTWPWLEGPPPPLRPASGANRLRRLSVQVPPLRKQSHLAVPPAAIT